MESMRFVILIFLIALAITLTSTPFVRRLALLTGFVDTPSTRKLHSTPMPLLGGLAIVAGAGLATVLVFVLDVPSLQADSVRGVLLASMIVALTGLVDDQVTLPPWAKMLGLVAGFLVLIVFDVRVKLPLPEVVNYTLTFLWVIGISNAVNFLDNMDGLSAGVCAVAAAYIMVIGAMNSQYLVSGLAAAVFGATLGFLRYNFQPATIFMGDVGSLFLGFLLAVLALQLRFRANVNFVTWMVPIFVLGVPIFDMSLVVFSRLRRGVSPLQGGKDHLSHRLNRLIGLTQRETVLVIYLLGAMLGIVALLIMQSSIVEGYVIGAVFLLLGMYGVWWFDNRPVPVPDLPVVEEESHV